MNPIANQDCENSFVSLRAGNARKMTAKTEWYLKELCYLVSLERGAVVGCDSTRTALTKTTLIIDGLNRDVLKKRSIVTLKWEDDPEKRLGLVVPFDCPLDTLRAEAEKAVRVLAKELESATIQGP
jgi:hypothetical protein